MSAITTHILDTSKGRPAQGVKALLELLCDTEWKEVGSGITNADGRIADLISSDEDFRHGVYKLTFDTQSYFDREKIAAFYPSVQITFNITDVKQHYHVPLLLNPFGYSTYRGS